MFYTLFIVTSPVFMPNAPSVVRIPRKGYVVFSSLPLLLYFCFILPSFPLIRNQSRTIIDHEFGALPVTFDPSALKGSTG